MRPFRSRVRCGVLVSPVVTLRVDSELRFPVRFKRKFSLHLYWVSHGLMLLRSGKSAVDNTRVDLLFQDVVWMAIPAWFDSLELSLCDSQAVTQSLGQKIRGEARFRNCYSLKSEDAEYFVIAGRVSTAEDECEYFQPSALIPDLQITQTFPS